MSTSGLLVTVKYVPYAPSKPMRRKAWLMGKKWNPAVLKHCALLNHQRAWGPNTHNPQPCFVLAPLLFAWADLLWVGRFVPIPSTVNSNDSNNFLVTYDVSNSALSVSGCSDSWDISVTKQRSLTPTTWHSNRGDRQQMTDKQIIWLG